MVRLITIEREFGSGGGQIGASLARRLGWKLFDHELTQRIANEAHVDCSTVERYQERMDSPFRRLAKVFWRGSGERGVPLEDSQMFDADCMVQMMENILQEIAREGNAVIIGRGAPYLLRGREDTLHLFTYASHDEKLRRICQQGNSEDEAEELVHTVDRERMAYVKHYFGADWPTRSLYHLMVNTGVGDENVIEMVLHAIRLLEQNPQGAAIPLTTYP